MDIIKENEKMVSVQYDSILDIINGECPSKNEYNKRRFKEYKNHRSNHKWFGPTCTTAPEIIEKALLGDHKLYEKYLKPKMSMLGDQKDVADSEQTIQVVKRKRIRCDQGDELDIHKVYQGQMDKAWSKTERIEVAQKFHLVTLMINYGGNCDIKAEDSLWRAAVAVRLATELEAAGKSVQILVGTVSNATSNSHNKLFTESVVIKRFNQKLSMERLAALSHIGAFRVFGFLGIVSQPSEAVGSLGYSSNFSENTMPIHLQEEVDAGHTKFIHIGQALTLHSAKNELARCYAQMQEFAGQN